MKGRGRERSEGSTFKAVTDPGHLAACEHLPSAELFNRGRVDGDSFSSEVGPRQARKGWEGLDSGPADT